MNRMFERLTAACARFTGRPSLNGANLGLSVVTLLLLPILQATQNRDGAALQAKLDELIKSNNDARNALIGLESKGEREIEEIRQDAVSEDDASET